MTNKSKNILIRSLDDVAGKFLTLHRNTPEPAHLSQRELEQEKILQGYDIAEPLQQAVIIAQPSCLTDTPGIFINKPDNVYEYVTLVDFSEAPQLEVIDLSRYNGQPGCPIRIKAAADYQVAEIWVCIRSNDGCVSESGMAWADGNTNEWVYITKKMISYTDGRTMHIQVTDLAGYLMKTPSDFSSN
jgi:hypothetical protein